MASLPAGADDSRAETDAYAVLLQNDTGLDIEVYQVGCTDCIAVASGSSCPFSWPAAVGTESGVTRLVRLRKAMPTVAADRTEGAGNAQESHGLVERRSSHSRASNRGPDSSDGGKACIVLPSADKLQTGFQRI